LIDMSNWIQKAIEVLELKRRPQRPNIEPKNALPGLVGGYSKNEPDLKGTPSIVGMKEWLGELGHSVITKLCFYVAGVMLT